MNLPKKQTKIFFFFNNFFSSPKSKRAVFFVFLAVLVLGFSFSFHVPSAFAWVPTQAERDAMKNGLWKATDAQIDQVLKDHPNVKDQLTLESYLPQKIQADRDAGDATGLQVSNPDVGLKSALSGLSNALAEIVLTVVIGVLAVIATFCKQFVSMGAQTLDFTLNPSLYSFTSNNMIVQGWTVVRDVCNLFFLLVLLFIAICTILKIEKYHAKKTLLMLIIMALLINFSKPIAIFIFDGSQLLMNFFLSQMGQTGTGQTTSTIVAKSAQIADLVYNSLPKSNIGASDTSLNIAVSYLFGVVFLFMLGVAFFVTALMLIIRIVVTMLLIIVSPFAFFAAIIPDFSKMSSQWWSSLFEYSYYGPAAAFFLLLATKLEDALPHLTNNAGGGVQYTAQNFSTTVNNITHYLTVIVFLYASIFMAKKFGGGAGAAIVGNANKFMKWGAGATKTGGIWGAGARMTGAADVYKGVKGGIAKQPGWRILTKEGREARSKEKQEKWEEKVAPFNISNVRKKAKEMENDAQGKIDTGVRKGNAAAIHEASRRGTLTVAQMQDPRVKKLMQQNPDFQKDIFKNLADKGQAYKQAEFQAIDQIGAPGTINGAQMDVINGEIYKNTSNNKLVEQDLAGAVHNERDRGGTFINDRLTQYYAANPTGFDQLYNRATNQHTITILNNIKAGRPALTGIPHP